MRVMRIAAVLGAMSVALPASAITYSDFPIDGSQETPPVVTPATGVGTVTLVDQSPDPDDWLMSWEITYTEDQLLGDYSASHFHGPADYGQAAGVRVNIPNSPGNGSLIGDAVISDAFAAELMAGLWYVNIHSDVYPGGEIRGQVVPEPGAIALLGIGGLALLRRRRKAV